MGGRGVASRVGHFVYSSNQTVKKVNIRYTTGITTKENLCENTHETGFVLIMGRLTIAWILRREKSPMKDLEFIVEKTVRAKDALSALRKEKKGIIVSVRLGNPIEGEEKVGFTKTNDKSMSEHPLKKPNKKRKVTIHRPKKG